MKKSLLVLLLFFSLRQAYAQSDHIKFEHLAVKDGLPSAYGLPVTDVTFVKQDEQGYIWIGTQDGVVRYDGYKTQLYPLMVYKDRWDNEGGAISMITDNHKDIWVTLGGRLFRYNRSADNFIQYKSTKTLNHFFLYTTFLQFSDDDGNIWGKIFTFTWSNTFSDKPDLFKFDKKKSTFEYFGHAQKGQRYLNFTGYTWKSITGDHAIWAGSKNGLYRYNKKTDTFDSFLDITDTLKQKSVFDIYEAPSEPGILWMNVSDHFDKQNKIERLDTRNKTFKDYSHLNNMSLTVANDAMTGSYEDKRQRLWFTTRNGLMLYNRKTGNFTNYLPRDIDKAVKKNSFHGPIAEDKNGLIWFRSDSGLLSFDPITHQFQLGIANPKDPAALSGNEVSDLLADRSGSLWAGIRLKGVDKLNALTSAFKTYNYDKDNKKVGGYPGGDTTLMASSADGYIYFTNKQGIYKWKLGTEVFSQVYKAKKRDSILSEMALGKNGTIYFSNKNGLQEYDPSTHKLQSYSHDPNNPASISSNSISKIIQDHTGTVWVGTFNTGLCALPRGSHHFTRYNDFSNTGMKDTVSAIYEDRQGTVWTGSTRGGLCCFDRTTGKFKSYLKDGSKEIKNVTNIFEDREGRLWVGTGDDGLFKFDRDRGHYSSHINDGNGLIYREVIGIREDHNGYLWINSIVGLTRLKPADMSIKIFPINTILPGENALLYYENLLEVNGIMVMGINQGITSFDPGDLNDNADPPLVHIEQVSFNNPGATSDSVSTRFVSGLHKIELPYNQNRVTFNYVALHFTDPAQNKYAYILEGFDKHWIHTVTQRSATYTNLSPGTYIFRVKASNSDGIWNNKGDSFLIIIHSPWWQRWWAWGLYIVLFATAIYAFIYFRSLKLIKEKRELERQINLRTEEVLQQKEEIEAQRDKLEMEKIRSDIAADFHDELGSTLSSIALYSEMAISDSSADERTKSILSLIGESSRGTVSAMQDMIWTIQPKNDKMQEVVYRMREYAYPLAELKNISLTFEVGEDVQNLVLTMDTRKNIYLIFKEAVNNTFKYAAAAHITINMAKHQEMLSLEIKDDGVGFDLSNARTGNGLTNMRKRAELAGGTLLVKSFLGRGTEILFSCPLS